mgnify:CR=1 FL=1
MILFVRRSSPINVVSFSPLFDYTEHTGSFCQILLTIVLFIPFFVFDFWSLLATKLRKYKILSNLCLYFARQDGQDGKKLEQKSHNWPKHQKPKGENRGWTKQNSITRPKLKAVADFHGVIYPAKILALFMRDLVRGLLVLILQNASVNRKNSHSYFCI